MFDSLAPPLFQYSLYAILLMASAVISGALAWYVWERRAAPGGIYFSLLMAAAAEWAFFNALEMAAVDLQVKIVFYDILYVGVVSIAPLWLLFALEYSKHGHWITARRKALLWALPAAMLVLAATNPWHGLIWSGITPVQDALGSRLVYEHAIGDWVIGGYSYVLLTIGTILLIATALRSQKSYRSQIGTLLLGTAVPWIGNFVYLGSFSPFPGLDLTPFALAITGLLFAWGIFRQHLFDIVPVARAKLITKMADGVLVLDDQSRIVDLNPAAQQLVGATGTVVGKSAQEALQIWPRLEEHCSDRRERSAEIQLAEGSADARWLDIRISPLQDHSGQPSGLLIILRDITERKRSEKALQRAYDELIKSNEALHEEVTERRKAEEQIRASLQEKEILLKEIHHRVKNNLQIISSLLNLQSCNMIEETALAFRESQSRIKSMALIHEKLYRSPNLSHIDFAEYVGSLTTYLARSYVMSQGVQIDIDIRDISLDIDTAIPCGLIITELVSNSIKYAFPEGRTGTIHVGLIRENGTYRLRVGDDGVGLPPGTDYRETSSLGLQLVNTLVDQLEGAIELEPGKGTTFKITFRENRNIKTVESG